MDYLWSPWRYRYVTKATPQDACIFCAKLASDDDEQNLIACRGERNFVLLNLYPYTSGHMMVAPYTHISTLEEAEEETLLEMMRLTRRAASILRQLYQPQGLNIGMNVGECAGAGVAGHIHMHVLPRWVGDSSFMTVVGETRIAPEDLGETWRKLSAAFARK